MIKIILLNSAMILAGASLPALAQNANSSPTMRPRTTAPAGTNSKSADSQKSTDVQQPTATQPAANRTSAKPKVTTADTPGSQSLVTAFNALIDGIRNANAKAVTNVYWNSPRLLLFNNNGTLTRGWEQMRQNRESSYKDLKDVKLEVRDLSITMLGRDGALVTCLWTQSQIYKGAPETASGRMTLVFRRVGKDWRAIHLHTSPDRPDPSRVMPSEQTPAAAASPAP